MLLPPPVPPGWYVDPYLPGGQRWWTGQTWTQYAVAPLPPVAPVEPERSFPFHVGWTIVAIQFASLVLEKNLLDTLDTSYQLSSRLATFVLRILLAYGPAVAFAIFAAHRWGAAGKARALGLNIRGADFGWGPITWLVMIAGQIFIAIWITATHIPLTPNVPKVTGGGQPERVWFFAWAFVGVIIAPLAEELIFRGVILPSFRSKWPFALAAISQGFLFGLMHTQPAFGRGNIGLVLILSWVGTALGCTAGWLQRIWPGIIAHAMMNSLVFLMLYGRIYWNWKLPKQTAIVLHLLHIPIG